MPGLTVRAGWQLVPYTVRAMRWGPFLVAAAVGFGLVAIPAVTSVVLSERDLTRLLRLAAVCAGTGAAFLIDDPAVRSIVVVPTGRLVRHAVRAAIALPAFAAWWVVTAVVTVAGAEHDIGSLVPVWGVTLEAATLVSAALALAATGLRLAADGTASTIAVPGLFALAAAMVLLPSRVALFIDPDDPQWSLVHGRWWLVLAATLAVGLWASRDRR